MAEDYRLSVVICAIDETFSLENTFHKIDGYGGVAEYLFVLARTCTPGCLATVKKLCAREDCRWVYQSGKGLGNAIRESFREVTGTHMVVWSADEGTDVASFPLMAALSRERPDTIVKISRWMHENGFEDYGRLKKLLNFISQRCFALMFRSPLSEFTNPTQIAPVAVYRAIRWERTDFALLPEMIFKPLKLGVPFAEVPTKNVARVEGRSHNTFKGYCLYYCMIFKIFFTPKQKLLLNDSQGMETA